MILVTKAHFDLSVVEQNSSGTDYVYTMKKSMRVSFLAKINRNGGTRGKNACLQGSNRFISYSY